VSAADTESREVIVVGAGVMGAAAAWQLARRGHRVTVLEQFDDGHTRGSSHGASRIFRLGYADPFYVRLGRDALGAWRDLEEQCGMTLIAPTGTVDLGDVESVAAVLAAMDAEGVLTELLTPAMATDRWPGMRFVGTVVFQPGGGRIASGAARLAMIEQAQRHGAAFCWLAPALGIEPDGDRVRVIARDDVVIADTVVVTAGPWVDRVAGALVDLPPVRVTQESVFHFTPRVEPSWWPSLIHHGPTFVYGLETPGLGVKLAEHHTGPIVDPYIRDGVVDPGSRERIMQFVEAWMPGLEPRPVDEVTCLYTTLPNEDFVIDRVGPVVIASPCSGHGFKFAPLIGAMIADAVEEGETPERFRLGPR
jgi:sarcosine oxidase